ncbi:MAG: geranylgeranyl reductase family protein [Bacillota bacterium]
MDNYDVIISGAGPAGATAAIYAARAGLKVLLLDKSLFPRPKPCAGGVTMAALAQLPIPLANGLVLDTITKLNANYLARGGAVPNDEPFMVTVDRRAFDNWLVEQAQAAGTCFRQGVTVGSSALEGSTRRVATSLGDFTAQVVIAADGIASRLAGAVRRRFRRSETGLCLVAEASAPTLATRHRGEIVIDYGILPRGYGWLFPKGDRVNVGVAAPNSRGNGLRSALELLCQRWGIDRSRLAIDCWPVPLGGFRRPLAAQRLLLAGDAAGLADPLTGEGIRYALVSGRLAALAAVRICGGCNAARVIGEYDEGCQEIVRDLRAALMIAFSFFAMPAFSHRVLFHHPAFFARLLSVLQGENSYRQLLAWLGLSGPWLAAKSVFRSLAPSSAP